jgi:hypothetical protein
LRFQELLFNHDVPMNYSIADLEDDIKAIRTYDSSK